MVTTDKIKQNENTDLEIFCSIITVVYFIEWDTSERGDSGQIGPVASGEFEISADFHMITPIENPKCTEGNNMPNLNS